MPTRTPLPQNASAGVNDIDEMRIGFIQIASVICGRVKEYGRVESGDATDFPFGWRQMVRNQACNVRSDTVANEMHLIGRYATRVIRNIFD